MTCLRFLFVAMLFTSCVTYNEVGLVATEQSKIVNGKKEGVWKNCLNERLYSCAPEEAKYYEYVMLNPGGGWASSSLGGEYSYYANSLKRTRQWVYQSNDSITDSFPQPLNGTCTIYSNSNKKQLELLYKDGMLQYVTRYHRKERISAIEDYKNPIDGVPFTGYLTTFKRDGTPTMKCKFHYIRDHAYGSFWGCEKMWVKTPRGLKYFHPTPVPK